MTPELSPGRLDAAKRSYVTRRIELGRQALRTDLAPQPGDLCLARVEKIGHHERLELVNGRRAKLHVGDEILVCYGNRYATDQFESLVPQSLEPCRLVAAGGIASALVSRHRSTRMPTEIRPAGLVCDLDGRPCNVRDWAVMPIRSGQRAILPRSHVIVVVGSGMNAGKTTTVASIVRACRAAGLPAAAVKLTGTGAGGDMWTYLDAGAAAVFDFTDAGHASTAGASLEELLAVSETLLGHASGHARIIVAEIADGLLQAETAALIASEAFRRQFDSLVFAAADAMAALAGVSYLTALGLRPAAVSGLLTASPLAAREAGAAVDVPVLSIDDLERGERSVSIVMRSAHPGETRAHVRLAASL